MVERQKYKGDRTEKVVWWIITMVATVILYLAYKLVTTQSLPAVPGLP